MADINAIAMPKWGLEMTEGTIVKWHVAEGDRIAKGQVLLEIETEKIANEVESDFDGILMSVLVPEGEVKEIGALLAVVAAEGTSEADVEGFVASYVSVAVGRVEASTTAAPAPAAPAATIAPEAVVHDGPIRATPTAERLARKLGVDVRGFQGTGRNGRVTVRDIEAATGRTAAGGAMPVAASPAVAGGRSHVRATPGARRYAKAMGIDLATVPGSGRGGRISKADVEAAAGSGGLMRSAAAHVIPGENRATIQPLNSMRKTIARRLTESKQNVPHFYLSVDVELDRLLARRQKFNASSDERVSVNDFIVRAAALALRQVPKANVQFHDDALHYFENADISVAVAIEGGLITPIVRAADHKRITQIAAEVKDLAARARAGRLQAHEIEGGTLTISNLGMFGISQFDAVINPPQGAVLAIGAGEQRVVVRNAAATIATMMTVTMSCDHRAIDGALGAEFLEAFKALLEEPLTLVL